MKKYLKTLLAQVQKSRTFRKAYTAAVLAFGTPIGVALVTGTLTGGVALAALGAALLAGLAVYKVPNAPSNEG